MAKENNPALNGLMFDLAQSLGIVAIYLLPFMPAVSKSIWEQIGETEPLEDAAKSFLSGKEINFPHPGNKIKRAGNLFPRIVSK